MPRRSEKGAKVLASAFDPSGFPRTGCVLRLAGDGWRTLGLGRPTVSWHRTVLLALVCAAVLQAASLFLVVPALRALDVAMPDLGRFAALEGNLPSCGGAGPPVGDRDQVSFSSRP